MGWEARGKPGRQGREPGGESGKPGGCTAKSDVYWHCSHQGASSLADVGV